MIKNDEERSNNRDYTDAKCPYVGLRKPYAIPGDAGDFQEQKCRLRLQTPSECEESIQYYERQGKMKEVKCDNTKAIEMCRIVLAKDAKDFDVVCDTRHCQGEPLHLGLLGNQTGMTDSWTVVSDVKQLKQYLLSHASASRFGASFALLKCEKRHIFQVLTLPKLKKVTMAQRRKKVNFNIIVEDSVSRRHFYRTLSKTASTMRSIIYNKSVPATVLEFEKVQSYDSTTRQNLRRLFSGSKYPLADGETIGIEDFFTSFKESGYNTLFQEDNCWYDRWGTLLDLRYRTERVKTQETRDRIWREFVDLQEKTKRISGIDDFGITFLSCSVYAYLRTTNVFDAQTFPNVCFAGRHFSSFFLNYAKEYMILNDNSPKPFLAYTHVITSHEHSGRRIVNDDLVLSELFREAANAINTVTIFISDHGGKSTKFSSHTAQGRQEVFRPFIFMIIPHSVREKLGSEITNALVMNQKRLVGIQDLGDALLGYLKPNVPKLQGLFCPVSLGRTCEHLDLDSDVLCLCDGMHKLISNSSQVIIWAAEFALGSLNNMIQDQFTAVMKSKLFKRNISDLYGYGACQRYRGLQIDLPRQKISGDREILAFTLFIQPFDRKSKEVFDVQVSFPIEEGEGMSLDKFTRDSSFNEYVRCADRNVNPKLCTCRANRQRTLNWRKGFIKRATKQRHFSLKPQSQVIDHPCLIIVSRDKKYYLPGGKKGNAISTYEVFNACSYATYNLTVTIKKAKHTRISRILPYTVTVFPRTMMFLMTVKNNWKFGVFVPRFSFVKRTLRR